MIDGGILGLPEIEALEFGSSASFALEAVSALEHEVRAEIEMPYTPPAA